MACTKHFVIFCSTLPYNCLFGEVHEELKELEDKAAATDRRNEELRAAIAELELRASQAEPGLTLPEDRSKQG